MALEDSIYDAVIDSWLFESKDQRLDRKFVEALETYREYHAEEGTVGVVAEILSRSRVRGVDPGESFEKTVDRLGDDEVVRLVTGFPGDSQKEAVHEVREAARLFDEEQFRRFMALYADAYEEIEGADAYEEIEGYEGVATTRGTIKSYTPGPYNDFNLEPREKEIRNITKNLGKIAWKSVCYWEDTEIYKSVIETLREYKDAREASAVTDYLVDMAKTEEKRDITSDLGVLCTSEAQEKLKGYEDKEDLDADYVRQTVEEARASKEGEG